MKTVLSLFVDDHAQDAPALDTCDAQGVDFVELRLDRAHVASLGRWIDRCSVPVIATVIPREEGGEFPGTREESILLLRAAAAAGARHVDLDVSIARQAVEELPARCKPIVSHHDRRGTPRDLEGLIRSVQSVLPGAWTKVVTTAHRVDDGLRLVRAMRRVKGVTSAFSMGAAGRVSRLLSGAYGGQACYLAPSSAACTAEGQWTLGEYREVVPKGEVTDEWKVYGVLGRPLGHSLSPATHGAALRALEEPALYLPFEVDDVAPWLDEADVTFAGFSVTIPHKETVVAHCATLSDAARAIGAVNTLVRRKDGWHGENTDHFGMVRSLESVGVRLRDRRAIVLGGGGAARAAVHGLHGAGARVAVAVRRPEAVRGWVSAMGAEVCAWDDRTRWPFDVLVNATPVGLTPQVEETPFPAGALHPGVAVLDMVYRPLQTRLLREAEARGARIVPGLAMFLEQAFLQFEAWTGEPAPRSVMRQAVLRALKEERA